MGLSENEVSPINILIPTTMFFPRGITNGVGDTNEFFLRSGSVLF
jgi:hypothetical protein